MHSFIHSQNTKFLFLECHLCQINIICIIVPKIISSVLSAPPLSYSLFATKTLGSYELYENGIIRVDTISVVFAVLGCYAVYDGNCLLTFRDSLSVPSSRTKQFKRKHIKIVCLKINSNGKITSIRRSFYWKLLGNRMNLLGLLDSLIWE
jgi:hypothetical protein